MLFNRSYPILSFIIFCLSLSLAVSANAQSLSALRDQLTALNTQLASEKAALERAEKKLAEAEADFQSTTKELSDAKAAASQQGDNESNRKVRVVAVKYQRHEEKLDRYKKRVSDTKASNAKLGKEIAQLQARINKQTEVERQRQAAAEKAARSKRIAMQSAVAATPTPSRAQNAVKKPAPAKKMPAKPAGWPYLSRARAADIAYARKHLKGSLNGEKSGSQAATSVTASDSFGTAILTAVSANLYSAVEPVKSGKQLFKFSQQEEWHVIPKEDNEADYRIIVDTSNAAKPKLILFRNSLLN